MFTMTTQHRPVSFITRAQLISIVSLILQFDVQTRFASAEPLNTFVSHYEPLNYDRNHLEQTHQRVRRSTNEDKTLHLDFNAHGREFKLRLKQDTTIFTPDFETDGDFDKTKVYKGHVDGHSDSSVHGFVHKSIFEGNIKLSDNLKDQYHVEPARDHFDKPDFHSVIYKASDLHYPYPHGKYMDMSEKTKKWMEESRKLSDEHSSAPEKAPEPHRYRRASGDQKLICQIHLRADHLFTIKRAEGDAERAKLLMSKHVQAAHSIYSQTVFTINGNKKKGFGFAIKRMSANISNDDDKGKTNPYSQPYIGVEKFLDIISLEETSTLVENQFCLSHVFTYRDFEDGVLGLAWVGEAAGKAAGGICEIARKYSDGRKKTLNTGVVTFINYNKMVPSRISEVTFAHELGHNFGAKHDTSGCSDGNGGNYIMFPKATSGTDLNNRKFSDCSKRYVAPVIETKGQGSKGCFQATNASICGNQLVEENEDCDCGFDGECNDQCCISASKTNGCHFRTVPNVDVVCSPSQGLCCDASCQYSSTQRPCNHGECIENTNCTGNNATCPVPINRPDNKTDCNEDNSVCLDGECKGSRCLKFGKIECQCSESLYQCVLCCKDEGICKPHIENKTITDDGMIKLLPGAPCDNFQGYCDVLRKCRGVDSEGPLERIKNLLFGGDAINNLVDWVKNYWWAAVLIGIGIILLMAGFIKLCSVATPSSNPAKPKAKTLSLRRNPRPNQGYMNDPPPAYDLEMGNRNFGGGRNPKP